MNPTGNDNPNGNRFNRIYSRTVKFSDSFFPSCIVDWNELDGALKIAINKKAFQSSLIKLLRPPKSNTFKILDNIGLKYLTQLILDNIGLKYLTQLILDNIGLKYLT